MKKMPVCFKCKILKRTFCLFPCAAFEKEQNEIISFYMMQDEISERIKLHGR
jgi:hypothetical protein